MTQSRQETDLLGTIEPGAFFVVGGPLSDTASGMAVFDQPGDFAFDIPNGGSASDAVWPVAPARAGGSTSSRSGESRRW